MRHLLYNFYIKKNCFYFMARSKKKLYFTDIHLLKKIEKSKADGSFYKGVPIKTHSRRSMITDKHVGGIFLVYNGKVFVSLTVVEEMIGHKVGEFIPTRRFTGHPDKKVDKKGK